MPVQPLTAEDPATVAGYALRARLGSGGMGRVYLAATPGGRLVALKLIRSDLADEPDFRRRFAREAAAAQRVHGLYTAQVLDADPDAARPWLVTAYVAGPTVAEAVDRYGPMPARTVLLLMAGVAEALQAIHAAGIVHRDLKPSNVLMAPDGPRVIDFGIARAADAAPLTRSGMVMGSPPFMAPEQVAGVAVTPAIDVFSLGSLAVFAARGQPPFGRDADPAVLYRVRHERPSLDGCQPPLLGLAERCLAKEPSWRPGLSEIIAECHAGTAGFPAAGAAWLPVPVAALAEAAVAPPLPAALVPPHPATIARPRAEESARFGLRDQVTTIGGPGGQGGPAGGWSAPGGWPGPAGWPHGAWPGNGGPLPLANPGPAAWPQLAPARPPRSRWALAALATAVFGALEFAGFIAAVVGLPHDDALDIALVVVGCLAVMPAGLVAGIGALVQIQRRRLRGRLMAISALLMSGIWLSIVVATIVT